MNEGVLILSKPSEEKPSEFIYANRVAEKFISKYVGPFQDTRLSSAK